MPSGARLTAAISKRSISRWTSISAVAPTKRTPWAWAVGTFFGAGLLKPAPGTWGSACAVLLYWAIGRSLDHGTHPAHPLLAIAMCLIATAIGIPAATIVARESARKDPGHVVIDEVAGQALTLIASPLRWKYLILSFILFRVFDIIKPPPVRALERLPEGTGIVVDDLGAGVYGLIILLIVLHLHLL